jgi:hypothetical protein
MSSRALQRDFAAVRVEALRIGAGGRKAFNALSECYVTLGDGRTIHLELIPRQANCGGAGAIYNVMGCPVCGRGCLLLRVIPDGVGLVCYRCLRGLYGAEHVAANNKNQLGKIKRRNHYAPS